MRSVSPQLALQRIGFSVRNSSNFFLFTISQILFLCKASPETDILSKDVLKYGSKLFLFKAL